jgi:hypothetical protein
MNTDCNPGFAHAISLIPKSLLCFDFVEETFRQKKSVCLVPHVIKFKEESEVITWRCNWGNVCESKCLYAMSKDRGTARTLASTTPFMQNV